MRPLARTLSLVAYSLLAGCSPGGGRDFVAGTREGVAFDTELADSKFAIVGYLSPNDGSIQAGLEIRASSTTVSCDDLSFDWPPDTDPRVSAIFLSDRRGSEDLVVFVAFTRGTQWDPWWGGGSQEEGGPPVVGPRVPPTLAYGTWPDVLVAAAYSWSDASCEGGGVQATGGQFYSDRLMGEEDPDHTTEPSWNGVPQHSFDDYPVVFDVGDKVNLNLEFDADASFTVSAEAHFDATYCGAWLMTDRPPLPLVDECP